MGSRPLSYSLRGWGSDTRYYDLPSKVEDETKNLTNYFRKDGRLKVTDATEDEGQTLNFNITGLNEIDFAELKGEGYTEFVLRYHVKMTDDRWQNLKFNQNTYTNHVHWVEKKKGCLGLHPHEARGFSH